MAIASERTFYLEMKKRPWLILKPIDDGIVLRQTQIPVDYYRFVYKYIGERWGWVFRSIMDDEALRVIIHSPLVDIYLLYVYGAPAGFAELDRRIPNEIELVYFGLHPNYFGRGLGKYFLQWITLKAWEYAPRRLWLHTCEFDHPAALPNYLKVGFVQYDEQILKIPVPDNLFEGWQKARARPLVPRTT